MKMKVQSSKLKGSSRLSELGRMAGFRGARRKNVPFPLTPALSLGESGNRSLRMDKSNRLGFSRSTSAERSQRGNEVGSTEYRRLAVTNSLSPRERVGVRGKEILLPRGVHKCRFAPFGLWDFP